VYLRQCVLRTCVCTLYTKHVHFNMYKTHKHFNMHRIYTKRKSVLRIRACYVHTCIYIRIQYKRALKRSAVCGSVLHICVCVGVCCIDVCVCIRDTHLPM